MYYWWNFLKCLFGEKKLERLSLSQISSTSFFLNLPLKKKSSLDDHLNIIFRCFKEWTMLLKTIPALNKLSFSVSSSLLYFVALNFIVFSLLARLNAPSKFLTNSKEDRCGFSKWKKDAKIQFGLDEGNSGNLKPSDI